MFVDAHVHVHRFARPPETLAAAAAAGVVCIAVTETPKDFDTLTARVGNRSGVRVALGAHPLRAHALTREAMRRFASLVARVDYVGEVGLDGSREGRPSLATQRRVLDQVFAVPGIEKKVMTVHSRGAEAETVARLAELGAPTILHWYSGALKHADCALEAGMYFSVNAAMLRSKKGARLLRLLPPDRVLTETDGPYVRTGGRPLAPESIPQLVADIAGLWGCDPEQARAQIWSNMASLYARRDNAGTPVGTTATDENLHGWVAPAA